VYAVASDHDYPQGHPAERWLKDANISHISEDEMKYIESSTTGQSKNKMFVWFHDHVPTRTWQVQWIHIFVHAILQVF
jgi:hypothetical protein